MLYKLINKIHENGLISTLLLIRHKLIKKILTLSFKMTSKLSVIILHNTSSSDNCLKLVCDPRQNSNEVIAYSLLISLGRWRNLGGGNINVFDNENYTKKVKIRESDFGQQYDVKFDIEVVRMNWLSSLFLGLSYAESINNLNQVKILEQGAKKGVEILLNCLSDYESISWACTMDVSIRLANILYVIEIINKNEYLKSVFDIKQFDLVISKHLFFIIHHDENNLEKSNNHYLTNILVISLAFYCRKSMFTKLLASKYLQKLILEVKRQYNNDGSNFEDSTAYHRFMTEALLTTLLFTNYFDGRASELKGIIDKALKFCRDISVDNNEYPIIGDNDSGQFVDLLFDIKFKSKIVDKLNSEKLEDIILNLEHDDVFEFRNENFINLFSLTENNYNHGHCKGENCPTASLYENRKKRTKTHREYRFIFDSKPEVINYEDIGLFIIRNDMQSLTFKYLSANMGHSHCDMLSLTLFDKGWVIQDPGTSKYTYSVLDRDLYRRYNAHFSPLIKGDYINPIKLSWFEMINPLVEVNNNENSISARINFEDKFVERRVLLEGNEVYIMDTCDLNSELISNKPLKVAKKYGEVSSEVSFNMSAI